MAACLINPHRVTIGVFRKVVEHMPLAFSSQSVYLGSQNRGLRSYIVVFCTGTRLDWGAEEHTYGTAGLGVHNTGKK